MGLAALHAAREPLSDCMTVVPFETAPLADFRRRPTCGEDADSTGGRPAFFERGAVGDFFLAAIRASCLKTDESPSRVRRSVQLPYASPRPSRSTLLLVPRSTTCYPRPHCLGLPNDQSWDRGARRSTQRAGHALQQTRDVAGRADQKSQLHVAAAQTLPRKLLPTRAKGSQSGGANCRHLLPA